MNLGYIVLGALILILVTFFARFVWFLKKTGPSKTVSFGKVRLPPRHTDD